MKLGDKIVALRGTTSGDITPNKTYTIGRYFSGDEEEPEFKDDAGDWNAAVSPGGELYPDGFYVVK